MITFDSYVPSFEAEGLTAQQLRAAQAGGRVWRPSQGSPRVYLTEQIIADAVGIQNQRLAGEVLSNAEYARMTRASVWIGDDDQVHVDAFAQPRVITRDEIAARVAAALA